MRAILAKAAAAAALLGLAVFFPEMEDGSGAVLAGIVAFAGVALGLAAVRSSRPLPERSWPERARLVGLAAALGVALGVYNLLANYAIGMLDPSIHAEQAERFYRYSPWSMLVRDPIGEEIVFRLLLIGGLAWVVGRFTDDRRRIFHVALGVSAVLFGLIHIAALTLPAGGLGIVYAAGVAMKAGAAGLVLGWVFWRWGLPYSYACHAVANGTHLVLMPLLF